VVVTFTGTQEPTSGHPLYPYIETRCTNRQLGDGTMIPPETIRTIEECFTSEDSFSMATVTAKADKKKVAKLLGQIDLLRTEHDALRKQLLDELRWTQEENDNTRDGVDVETLEMPAPAIAVLKKLLTSTFVRALFPRSMLAGLSAPPIMKCSHLCVVAAHQEMTSEALVQGGRVAERCWLKTAEQGLAFQPLAVLPFLLLRATVYKGEGLSQPENDLVLQVSKELREVFGVDPKHFPLFIFRLSNAPAASKGSLRIPWESFTTVKTAS
jgi:hypothetical protein